MQTLNLGAYRATLSPTRDIGEFRALLAKCNGKHKPTSMRVGVKRVYPRFYDGMSTAEYVRKYESLNESGRFGLGISLKTMPGFFAPLNEEPCTLYSDEDSYEIVDDASDVDDAESIVSSAPYWNFSAETLTFERMTT